MGPGRGVFMSFSWLGGPPPRLLASSQTLRILVSLLFCRNVISVRFFYSEYNLGSKYEIFRCFWCWRKIVFVCVVCLASSIVYMR